LTLAIDIGGSHLKAAVLNASGKMSADPVRVKTPKLATPDAVVAALISLSQRLGQFARVSIGFPGVVRADFVMTAPNLGTKEWHGFRLGAVIAQELRNPVRMLNDASIQGLGVIAGEVLECVLTLGTEMGFALFRDGTSHRIWNSASILFATIRPITNTWARRRLRPSASSAGTSAFTRLSVSSKPL
jgi:polyphosphate glucokinase